MGLISLANVCAILHTNSSSLQPEASQLKYYDESIINTLDNCTLECNYQSKTYQLSLKVIDGDHQLLLSGITCTELGLITVHAVCNITSAKLIKQYDDVFKGLGCLGDEYHIDIDKSIPLIEHVPRRVPVAMKEPLKHMLTELTKQGIITKVEEPTP